MRTVRVKRLRSLVIILLAMSILMVGFALPPVASAESEMTRQSGSNEYFISTDNGAWIGHIIRDFVNAKNEKIYCVQPHGIPRNSVKTVEDALNYMPQSLITRIALGLESIRTSSIDEYTKSALLQAWVWMNVNGQRGCFTDTRVDEMYSMRGASREVQRSVIAEAGRYADENAGSYIGKGVYYRGRNFEQSQILFKLSPLEGSAEVKKESGNRSKLFSACPKMYSLAGAIYHVIDSNGQTVAELVTDKNGNTESKSLKPGKYKAREIKAPENMGLDENEYQFEIKPNEKYKIKSNDEPLAAHVDILIKKTASDKNRNKKLSLAGAEFSVEYFATLNDELKDVERRWTFVTDKDGAIRLDSSYLKEGSDELYFDDKGKAILPLGSYRISEIKAPKGFWLNKLMKIIKVKPVKDEHGRPVVSKYEVPSFEEKEQTVRIRVKKYAQDQRTPKPLAGAHFSLKRVADAYGKAIDASELGGDERDIELVTGENGIAEKRGLLPGIYELKETKAPQGYVLSKENIKIEARASDGDKLAATDSGESEFLYESQIGNVPIKLEISKVTISDGKKHALKGSELLLKDADGKIIDRWVSDGTAHRIECIKEGKYTIVEEKAPHGYERLVKPVEITVHNTAELQHFELRNDRIPDHPNTGDGNSIIGYILSLIAVFIIFWVLTDFSGRKSEQ